jgi:Uma2 family endonuclease
MADDPSTPRRGDMATKLEPTFTAEEYLAIERTADHRSELVNGRIYAMSGASRRHNLITLNLGGELRSRLRGRPCEAYVSEMRVKVSQTGMYTYPDVVVLCDPPKLEDSHGDTLLNPGVIIEVLSDSTEKYDRGDKFAHYRKLESLREYILISQSRMLVEQYVRHGDHWMLSEISDPAEALRVETLGCEDPLAEIYDRVEFEPDDAKSHA